MIRIIICQNYREAVYEMSEILNNFPDKIATANKQQFTIKFKNGNEVVWIPGWDYYERWCYGRRIVADEFCRGENCKHKNQ